VEKDLFKKVIQNYPSSSLEEAQNLHSLRETYPYSQLLHVLSARASKDHGFKDQQNELQLAAIYSADRGILKTMMSDQPNQPVVSSEPLVDQKNITINHAVEILIPAKIEKEKKEPEAVVVPSESSNDGDDLADNVIRDVLQLYKTRHNFEMMFVDNPDVSLVSAVSGEDNGKTKRERIIELSRALNAQPMKEDDEIKPAKKKRAERTDIIDEIVHTKSKIEPANEKQKEQLEIIDHFIKAQPSISNAKDKPAHIQGGDLSTIKAGEFSDNIVSETLVELLVKQGKKDKAIEVLKKLIWKFPQKKTYFAAQIEELKK